MSSRVVAAKYNGVANSQENYCIIREEKIYTSYVSVYKQYQGVIQIKFNYTKFGVYKNSQIWPAFMANFLTLRVWEGTG